MNSDRINSVCNNCLDKSLCDKHGVLGVNCIKINNLPTIIPTPEVIEQWWAEGQDTVNKNFWHEAPYRSNGSVIEEIKTAVAYFMGEWQSKTTKSDGTI